MRHTRWYCNIITVYNITFYILFPIFQVRINIKFSHQICINFNNQKVMMYIVKSFRKMHQNRPYYGIDIRVLFSILRLNVKAYVLYCKTHYMLKDEAKNSYSRRYTILCYILSYTAMYIILTALKFKTKFLCGVFFLLKGYTRATFASL